MKIRKATQQDAPHIAKVHVDSWRSTYRNIVPDTFLEKLDYDHRTKLWERNMTSNSVFVAENNDGEIVGFSTGGKEREGKYEGYDGELYAIYIFEEYQGKGIGRLLLQPVAEELVQAGMTTMLVWVLEDNGAKYFYEALGGKKLGHAELEIDGEKLKETAYGWPDLSQFVKEG
ncbi:GNAT family N-acetyltransferase [Virgibacillus salinus]|uniref:L-amino acid N-acyltransferase YncA n=1 Tax=Virgibacillus salinus TaxID=553311 RepID=A0A1H1DL21_9BACI|nr:GNAT family N-acetyltransferase [Virgibacillus salinus]SDQ77214.1 L-amino acid N-acyltransferase YncA [Virgibacillus salinus]